MLLTQYLREGRLFEITGATPQLAVINALSNEEHPCQALADMQTLAERWNGELEFFGSRRPASPMAWSFLFDIVHHRGQISTYLRPMGSTVPQISGPSGDEP